MAAGSWIIYLLMSVSKRQTTFPVKTSLITMVIAWLKGRPTSWLWFLVIL